MTRSPHRGRLAFGLAVFVLGLACTEHTDPANRALEVERRILSPCCLRETVDVHESEIAHDLRIEIRARIDAGEPGQAIEDDLVRRYGEKVRALPRGRDPRWMIGVVVAVALGVGAALILRLGLRGRRRRVPEAAGPTAPASADDEARLDDELLAYD